MNNERGSIIPLLNNKAISRKVAGFNKPWANQNLLKLIRSVASYCWLDPPRRNISTLYKDSQLSFNDIKVVITLNHLLCCEQVL